MVNDIIISGLQIHTENELKKKSAILIRDQLIHAVDDAEKLCSTSPRATVFKFSDDYHLVPGFIDLHVHGANGSDVMDATPDAFSTISQALAKEGTTSYLATTMTASKQDIEKTLQAISVYAQHQKNMSGATILGVHLEGPFVSPKKAGAQRADILLEPNIELMEQWQKMAGGLIKLVTLAPELPNSLEFIAYLKKHNIIASIGHTDATFSECKAAIAAGCSHATHLFNAMRGIHQREPGPVVAALVEDSVLAELILDGIHLHPAIAQLVFKLKGKKSIALVTDAMRAKCLQNGVYDLGGQAVTVKNNEARLADGTLAGSVLKMNSALKNFIEFTGCSLDDALQMTSANPARALGVSSQKGSVTVGKDADLVVLNKDLNVVMTIQKGRLVYECKMD